jgi:hypothetical protein
MDRACLIQVVTLLALGLTAYPSTAQQWAPSGIPVCQNGCLASGLSVILRGSGGAFVAWRDVRNSDDVFLQNMTVSGLIAPGWPVDGLPIVVLPSTQEFSGLAPDGLGGALVAWEDWRNLPVTGRDPYVQRVLADGSLPMGWVLDGNPASLAPGAQFLPQVAPDGVGGAYVIWQDSRDFGVNGYDVYAQHLTATGSAAAGWPSGGLALAALPGAQGSLHFQFPDDAGGVVVVWTDSRAVAPGIYGQRLRPDGTINSGWTSGGTFLLTGQPLRLGARDEAGGFYVVSSTSGPTLGFDGAIYLRRFTFAGTPAPGWPAGGLLVCNAPGDRAVVGIDSDGAGGALLSWYDYRPPYDFTGGEIFAVRVRSDGTLAPGWSANGTLVSDPADGVQSYDPFVVRDGQGGGYVVWQSQGGNELPSWIQHLTASGQAGPGWPQYGLRVAPSGAQFDTRIAIDGQGGAIVAWDERCCGRVGVWAQRFGPNGPTPTLLSLVSAVATNGLVQLDWYSPDAAALSASVYRRTGNSDWLSVASVVGDGTGHLRYEDSAVSAGVRYAYRLGYLEQGLEQFTAETWVEVPALKLALEGLRPNPAVGDLMASFTLSSGAPARLQLLDVTGRVWLAREVGGLGAGNHLFRLGGGATVPAGMYWLRLTQGGRSLLARRAVVR